MMTKNQISEQIKAHLMPQCFNAAVKAGAAIMKIYKNIDDYDISLKSDHTPITIADRVAHTTIKEFLGSTRIPVLSEEGREMHYDERRNWDLFFLVDPLDGTVEFIKGNNEFTVNIALMSDNRCVTSVLYVPYHRKMYLAFKGHGAYLINDIEPDDNPTYDYARISFMMQRLPLESTRHDHLRVAVSRSHQTPETFEQIDRIRKTHPDLEIVEQGSSYKFCLLAEGTVDYYVRTTNTYEWDTAAGELILAEAGGKTVSFPDGQPLVYNKADLAQPIEEGIAISAAKGDIQPLLDEIHRLFDHHRIALSEPSLANERQIALMRQAHASMASAISALEQGLELELAQIDLQEAYTSLKEILGEVHREDLIDTLFANFCLGK